MNLFKSIKRLFGLDTEKPKSSGDDVDALINLLKYENPKLPSETRNTLVSLGSKAVPALIAIIGKDDQVLGGIVESRQFRSQVAEILIRIGQPSVALLQELLEKRLVLGAKPLTYSAIEQVAKIVKAIGDPSAVNLLADWLMIRVITKPVDISGAPSMLDRKTLNTLGAVSLQQLSKRGFDEQTFGAFSSSVIDAELRDACIAVIEALNKFKGEKAMTAIAHASNEYP